MKKNCYHLKVGNEWTYFLLEQSIIKTCHNFNRTLDWLKIINYKKNILFIPIRYKLYICREGR